MKKYPYNIKINAVMDYLNKSTTYKRVAEKNNLSSPSALREWVRLYRLYGKEGLKEQEIRTVFPVQLKLDVLRYRETTGFTYQETADAFGIRFASTVRDWHKLVQSEGIGALKETKGRTPMAEINRRKKKEKELKKQKNKGIHTDHIVKLERENELLRLENEYLKKIKAFQGKRHPEKHNLKWRTHSSKKDSN